MLTPQQRAEYETTGFFHTAGADARNYRLGIDMQIYVHAGGKLIERWCAYLPGAPREDTIVAHLLYPNFRGFKQSGR